MFSVKLVENDSIVINDVFDGIFDNNMIKYNDGVNNIFDLNKLVLERISDSYKLVFDFSNFICYSFVDGLSVNMTLDVIDKRISSNHLFFKYKIVDIGNIYEYSVKW